MNIFKNTPIDIVLHILSYDNKTIKNGKIQLLLNGKSLYCDGSHLSHDGAILIKPMLEKVLN